MVCALFVGCGGSDEGGSSDGKLTVGIMQNTNVTSFDDNAYTKWIEETLGIDLEFVYYSSAGSEAIKQLSLTAASGKDLPDVILGFHEMNHYTVNEFGEEGYFIDLTDLIDKYGKNYKAALEKLPEEESTYLKEKAINTTTGEIYAMPIALCSAFDDLQNLMYINQDWLDKLGLKAPTNTEELYNVLKEFKTKDPNGNGEADEVPMLGGYLGRGNDIISYLINAFVYYNSSEGFNVTDGVVWDPLTTNEFRQALIYGNKLVKEGLLSDLTFTLQANNEYMSLITPADGPSKVGIFCGYPDGYMDKQSNAVGNYTALGYLADATGKGGYTVVNEPPIYWSNYITSSCDDKASAMKLIDLFYSDESIMRSRHGEKDVDWTYGEGVSPYGTKAFVNIINGDAYFKGNSTWCKNMAGIMTHENYIPVAVEGEGVMAEFSRLQKESWEILEAAKMPEERVLKLVYTQEEYSVREEYVTPVNTYYLEQINLFVSGQVDPNSDAEWNKFLSTLEKVGRTKLLEVAQEAYDRK